MGDILGAQIFEIPHMFQVSATYIPLFWVHFSNVFNLWGIFSEIAWIMETKEL